MLRSFRFANHKSFRDEAELLLMPAYDKSSPVVPVAGIFGANASGKSNLLDALRWMRNAVLVSHWQWEPGRGVPRSPFRLSRKAHETPSHYTVEIVVDGVRHVYGFVTDDHRIRQEWLYAYPHSRKRIIFEREEDGGWTFGTSVPRGEADTLRKVTRDSALFLGVGAQFGLAGVLAVFTWFQELAIYEPGGELPERDIIDWLGDSSDRRARLVDLVRAADLGITDIRTRRVDAPLSELDFFEEHQVPSRACPLRIEDLAFVYGHGDVDLSKYEQSRGTLVWMNLVTRSLNAMEHGSVLCIDEVDASLHPHLTARLIDLFREADTNPLRAQLLFTTHDPTLLDDEVLRRDEIWFVEKERGDGSSTLYPLSDFHPRKGENTEGRYLAGSYGAVPLLTSVRFRDALDPGWRTRAAA